MIFPTADHLAAHPGLIPWLRQWECDEPATMQRALAMAVASIRLAERLTPDGQLELVAHCEVRDPLRRTFLPQLHLESFYLTATRSMTYGWTSKCKCDLEFRCDHAVAVMNTLRAIAQGPPGTRDSDASRQLADWLRALRSAEGPRRVQPAPAKPQTKFLVYCIDEVPQGVAGDGRKWEFTMRLGKRTKRGISVDYGVARADPNRPPRYMAPEDLPICEAFHQRQHRLRQMSWRFQGSMPLEGEGWEDILLPALATGRLLFTRRRTLAHQRDHYSVLEPGPPLALSPGWTIRDDGRAAPVLSFPGQETHIFLKTRPFCYLDPENFRLGLLETTQPAAFLLAWEAGPAIPPASVPELQRELAALSQENPLPLPLAEEPEIRTGLAPQPVLRIREFLIGIYQERHIAADPQFVYPGCLPLPPVPQETATSWFDGSRLIVLHRDLGAEREAIGVLSACGFTPVQALVDHRELNNRNRHVWLLGSLRTRQRDWLEFVAGPHYQRLLEAGWHIETEPKLGLVVHEVRDFFPAIESEPDHGIDWFRFDITGEFDGKRVSLIPQIAKAIREDLLERHKDRSTLPETLLLPCDNPADGYIRFPAARFLDMVEQVRSLFLGVGLGNGPLRLDRLSAAGVADALDLRSSETSRALALLSRNLRDLGGLPPVPVPEGIRAELRPYQTEGFRWLQFLAAHGLHGILADDMGLGKTLQTLAHLAAEHANNPGRPSLVVAPTSVVPNWAAELEKFAPDLKALVLHGMDRANRFEEIPAAQVVITSYPLLVRDCHELAKQTWHVLVLDEAQYIKNPRALTSETACKLVATHRLCLSGTPLENHLGELWSLMRFLMPGFLANEKTFNTVFRKPIERDHSAATQIALNRRVAPLILRRTKDQVAADLPAKTTLIHGIDLTERQADLYESVRAAMDQRVREAVLDKGLAGSQIIVLDALLKLRQVCCHPQLLRTPAARHVTESAKLAYLTAELLPTLIEEGRRILLFSQFTSMLALIEEHLVKEAIPFLKLTGETKERAQLVRNFQTGAYPVFLISLKAGGTGLNLTAADTVIHYDPWWNPAAENQATDRAHRIGQNKPVFVHKLVCRGTIEERILELQRQKAALVEALLAEDTVKLRIDEATLSHLFSPIA